MIIQYDKEQLGRMIRNLFELTGISISVLDADYKTLAHCSHPGDFCTLMQSVDVENENCKKCDKKILETCNRTGKLEGHICSFGLYDSAMPIVKHDTIVGYIIMGRVRSVRSPAKLQNAPPTDAETAENLALLYNQLPFLSEKQLSALYDLLPSVLFDSAIRIVYDPIMNEIIEYIDRHIRDELSVANICEKFYLSVNHLYSLFRENFDSTVNDYITEKRIALAKSMLTSSDKTVCEIAENVGISNYPYFCKLFKKKTGVTPSRFRKTSKKIRSLN